MAIGKATLITADLCPACAHEVGYHYEDDEGNVVCRFTGECGCVEPHFGTIASASPKDSAP